DADLRGMVVLRSLGFQLVPFKLHRFRKQRPTTGGVHINTMTGYRQQKPRLGLTKCPDLVEHYKDLPGGSVNPVGNAHT
ncbi:hypothetical protein, partial [Aeromonas salmonicida]